MTTPHPIRIAIIIVADAHPHHHHPSIITANHYTIYSRYVHCVHVQVGRK